MSFHRRIGNSDINVGDFSYGHEQLHIHQWGEGASLTVGKYCSFGHNITVFLGGDHRTDWITTYPFGHINRQIFGGEDIVGHPKSNGNIVIGNDVWVGADSKIMAGVTIGDGAVIAGSALVVKDVEPYSIVGGNPAKHIKYRFDDNILNLLKKLAWWDLTVNDVKNITKELCSTPTVETVQRLVNTYR